MSVLAEKTTGDIRFIRPQKIVNEFLKDTAGSTNLNVDGSITPVEFTYTVPVYPNAPPWVVSGLVFVIADGGIVLATKFAGINGGLANGIVLGLREPPGANSSSRILFNVKFNLDFALYTNEGSIGLDLNQEGTGPDSFTAFISSFPGGYRLLCKPGTQLFLIVQDDLSSIDRFQCVSHGFQRVG